MNDCMNRNRIDTVIRYVAFTISVALYAILLPIILSYSLGYHIDFQKLSIYKTGILSLRSEPSGSSLYINGKLSADLTPARIEELKPGKYFIEVKREGFYPWQKEVIIMPNMVTRAENIILFPVSQAVEKISDREAVNFAVSDDRRYIYYMTASGLFRSNLDGSAPKQLAPYSEWPDRLLGKSFSLDGKKILLFNENGIWVIYLNVPDRLLGPKDAAKVEQIYKSPALIKNAFWHSGSNHIILISDKDICVVESGRGEDKNPVTLYKCEAAPNSVYYDAYSDSLYFDDSKAGGKKNLYRLDLREKTFDKFMQRVKKEFEIIYEQK
jgi:hypothetical protein